MPEVTILGRNLKGALAYLGISRRSAGARIGRSEKAVQHIVTGTSRSPQVTTLLPLAQLLGTTIERLHAADFSPFELGKRPEARPSSLAARRFIAARLAFYDVAARAACEDMQITEEELEAFETGARDLPLDVLGRFHVASGIPLRWLQHGLWGGIPDVEAARIGAYDPELVPAPALQRRSDPPSDAAAGRPARVRRPAPGPAAAARSR